MISIFWFVIGKVVKEAFLTWRKNPGISFEIARISFYDNREKEEGDDFLSMVFRRDQALNMFEIENVLYLLQK